MRKKKAIIIFKAIISYNFDKDLEEIILTLSHASSNHRSALVEILKPESEN